MVRALCTAGGKTGPGVLTRALAQSLCELVLWEAVHDAISLSSAL